MQVMKQCSFGINISLPHYGQEGCNVCSSIGRHGSVSGICDKDQQEQNTQRYAQSDGHAVVKSVENGLKYADKQSAAKPEADTARKTNMSVKVPPVTAVIPPADSPLLFEPDAGHIFQRRAHGPGEHKNQHRPAPQSVKQQD